MSTENKSRRQFLQGVVAGLGIFMAGPIGRFFPESQPILSRSFTNTKQAMPSLDQSRVGELYAGFLLLPNTTSIPDFIQCVPAPILGQVDNSYDLTYRGETVWFENVKELISYLHFPIYVPATLPTNIEFINSYVIQFAGSGDIFEAVVNFGAKNTEHVISMQARPTYPQPYPIWPVQLSSAHNKEVIQPEKVTFLPQLGISQPSISGHIFHWIEQDVLYTLVAEHDPNYEAAIAIAQLLIQK